MKRIAIVIPPITDFYYTPHRGSFLGARIVKKRLEKNGFTCKLFDFPNKKSKKTQLPRELDYLIPYINENDNTFFKGYKRFGYSFEKCKKDIIEFNPDGIILSLFAFAYAKEFIDFAKFLQEKMENIPLFAGGTGITCFPEYFEKTGLFDSIFTGEIEVIEDKVIEALNGKLKGIVKSREFSTQNDIDFVISHTLSTRKERYFSTMLSRGCPKKCSFCSNFIVQGRKFRTVPIEKVEKEVKNLNLSGANINFEDDNILLAKDYLSEVINLIKKYHPDTTFSFENGIDHTFLNIELTEALIKSGIKQFNLSIGHIDPDILGNNKRPAHIEKLIEITHILKRENVPCIVYFITGLKNDSFEKTLATIDFLKKLPCLIGISPFYPVPGIEGFTDKEIFEKVSPVLTKGSSFYPWNNSLTTDEMITAFKIVRKINLYQKN